MCGRVTKDSFNYFSLPEALVLTPNQITAFRSRAFLMFHDITLNIRHACDRNGVTCLHVGALKWLNPLSLERGGGIVATHPPFRTFFCTIFCVFTKIAIQSIYPPFIQIPMYL